MAGDRLQCGGVTLHERRHDEPVPAVKLSTRNDWLLFQSRGEIGEKRGSARKRASVASQLMKRTIKLDRIG